ncbi:hypothetical protein HY339_03135 [Candidatus Gottesmanbacteria bacterium]|nr:hypothetical protein [Candidatus Gottesmanbacteria bacterium]
MTIPQLLHRCQEVIKRHWPLGLLMLLEGVLVGANYKPGTFLMGWDNMMPEFNFRQALVTNIFGVWQEHRGLGLYDGMGHAANLIHTIFLWLLSFALPTNLLRYSFHFLMHLLGGIGAYILLHHFIDNHIATARRLSIERWIALAGSLFYMLNLATIQMFYTPLEAFSVHFAALPWLAWSLVTYLHEGSRKRFLVFLLISLLSTPQFFIPTLLLPVALLLVSISITSLANIKRICVAACGFFLINAFWLLPYVYGLPQNAPVIQAAKINQMSSEEVFARNQAFGDLGSVLRLRGFPLDFEDTDAAGATTYLMAPWREFLTIPVISALSWLPVAGLVPGIASPFTLLFLASFIFLANNTPVIKEVTQLIRMTAPWFAEAYRLPFTKFSLLFALSSSILFAFGVARIAKIRIVPIIVVGIIVILAVPAFRGNFFSQRLRVPLPNDYLQLFAFMKGQPAGRVAYLPQHQYWSWKYYDWGYRGSGFLWYGLTQPILDRAFDPWSGYNENYYWEISRSIYSKDVQSLSAVLDKYDVRYLLLDEHIVSPSHNRALFTEEIKAMLAGVPEVKEIARFGTLTVYERGLDSRLRGNDKANEQSFISLKSNLPTVSPAYGWTDNDVAFGELGDYITESSAFSRQLSDNNTITYPFRLLFTKRTVGEREFDVEETEERLLLRSRALAGFPLILEKGDVEKQKNDKKKGIINPNLDVNIHPIDHTDLLSKETASTNDTIPADTLIVNGNRLPDTSEKNIFGNRNTDPSQAADKLVNKPETTRKQDFFSRLDITTSVSEGKTIVNASILKTEEIVYDSTGSADLIAENVKPCGVLRKGEATAQNVDQFLRFRSYNQRGCLSFSIGNLPHRDGYLVAVENRHIAGRPLLFSLINETARHVELETYLEGQTDYFILPPLAADGLGYTVYLSNDAIGKQETVNDLVSIKVYRVPYGELVHLRTSSSLLQPTTYNLQPISVDHPNPAYYKIEISDKREVISKNQTLILSQSFDNGWMAFVRTNTFPFFTVIKDHVLVNNWENGWKLQSHQNEIVIFFLPQLLELFGFILLPIPFLVAMKRSILSP